MKVTKFLALALAGAISAAPAFARSLAPDYSRMAKANQAFGQKLLGEIAAVEHAGNANKNIFLSPLSASLALSMLINGAKGDTFNAIGATLQFGDAVNMLRLDEINWMNAGLIADLAKGSIEGANDPERGSPFTLTVANSVWSASQSPFRFATEYVESMQSVYKSEARTLDFKAPEAAAVVNKWASDNTNGKIPSVIDADTLKDLWFVLMNATYFKAQWYEPFWEQLTKDAPFTRVDGSKSTVKMMQKRDKILYRETADAQIAQLPYMGDAAMYVVLPKPGVAVASVKLDGALIDGFESGAAVHMLDLKMPKFSFDYSIKMNDVLKAMGMGIAFENYADFSGIGSPATKVGLVKQDTFVKLDEKGTEAAAVTLIGGIEATSIGRPLPEASMTLDRPFSVVVVDTKWNVPLFVGYVMNPEWK